MANPPSGGGGGGSTPPEFRHIHCSSRFDRAADLLEIDLDTWMAQCSVITLTEVNNDNRAAKLREKGWRYFNAKLGGGRDDVAIAWAIDTWRLGRSRVLRLSDHPFERTPGHRQYTWASTVVLHHSGQGQKLLVSLSHMPAHVENTGPGPQHWRTTEEQWQARKAAYLSSLSNWSTHVKDMETKHTPDATMIVADWNLDQKETWVQDLLNNHWGKNYHMAWKNFPTTGTMIPGGPSAPAGSPGAGTGERIIDGTLYKGLNVTVQPDIMNAVRSSDHRPYKESFAFLGSSVPNDPGPPGGHTKKGHIWWGFGDTMDDEIYDLTRVTE